MRNLTRRSFIGGTAGAGAAALAATQLGVPGLGGLSRLGAAAGLASPAASAATAAGPLVLLTLDGGNDGLNTVIPYETGQYHDWRGGLAIPQSSVLPLGSFDGVALGLHPALTGLSSLWAAGKLAVICGVEYPDPSFSHFQSTTIWQTAETDGENASGWIGRWLDRSGEDPLRAIGVGSTLRPALVGARQQGSTVADSTSPGSQTPWQGSQFMASYDQLMARGRGRDRLEADAASCGTNMVAVGQQAAAALKAQKPPADPGNRDAGDIGTQLSVVAELIAAGLPTRVYSTGFGSFDTHANQAWTHQYLLGQLDAAVADFVGAFDAPGTSSPVVLIHSEFGRTPRVNASNGTDHSSPSVVLVAGPGVRGGFYGAVPSFTALDPYGNQVFTTDFRSVYATALESILGIESAAVLHGNFAPIPYL